MEIGNMLFNTNANQQYECPQYVIALLEGINTKLSVQYWNKFQKEIESPFENTASHFKNDVFEVEAYSWDDEYCQPYNFKWNEIEISWYKYLGRDTTVNVKITPERAIEMFDSCIESLSNFKNIIDVD